jgi:hypothetical protein
VNISGLTTNNIKNGRGLYIANSSSQSTVVSGLTVTSNTPIYGAGGGAYVSVSGELSLTNTNISGTQASDSGGGLYIANNSGLPTNISGLTISDTSSNGYGGGVYVSANGSLSVTDTDISGTHTGNGAGGGLYINNYSTTQSTNITRLKVNNAKAMASWGSVSGGGAYISVRGGLSLTDAEISETQTIATDSSSSWGGGLYISNSSTTQSTNISGLKVNKATAASGESGNGGGAYIFVRNGLSLTDTEISETKTTGASGTMIDQGGGLYIDNSSTTQSTVISGLTVKNVTATSLGYGGGLFFQGRGGTVLISNALIQNASATTGGAIASIGPVFFSLAGVSFQNCIASSYGLVLCGDADQNGHSAYVVRPGCRVDGTEITLSNYSTILSPPRVSSTISSSISFLP